MCLKCAVVFTCVCECALPLPLSLSHAVALWVGADAGVFDRLSPFIWPFVFCPPPFGTGWASKFETEIENVD